MNPVNLAGCRFASLHRPSIKPGITGYFVGNPNEIKPGAIVCIIRRIDGAPILMDPSTETGRAYPRKSGLMSLHAYEQQDFVVDHYVVGTDGEAQLGKADVPATLGFNPFSGTNECITGLELKDGTILVTSPPSYYVAKPEDQPVIPLTVKSSMNM